METEKKRSRLGTISLILTFFSALLFASAFGYWYYCHSLYGYTDGRDRPIIGSDDDFLIDCTFALSFFLLLVSTIFSIIGLFNKNKEKLFPVLGLLFSILAWLGVFLFFYFDITP